MRRNFQISQATRAAQAYCHFYRSTLQSAIFFCSLERNFPMFKWLKSVVSKGADKPPHIDQPHHPKVSLDESLALAEKISKPCIFLKKEGAHLAAVWGGKGAVPGPSSDTHQHWISIDTSYLPQELGLPAGVMSVFSGGDDWNTGIALFQAGLSLDLRSGVPLYAHAEKSLPPPNAMPELDTPEYSKAWQNNCPLFTEGATAVIGGWHFPWPEDDWDALRQQTLVLWTIENSEPWVEVWNDGKAFHVCERVT